MKTTPMLFRADMVRALLREIHAPGTGKEQTRRTTGLDHVNQNPDDWGRAYPEDWVRESPHPLKGAPKGAIFRNRSTSNLISLPSPYGYAGDLIWVRESFCYMMDGDGLICNRWHYKADGNDITCLDEQGNPAYCKDGRPKSPWSSSIHMPRWANRITLQITDAWVSRLHWVDPLAALCEGVEFDHGLDGYHIENGRHFHATDPRQSFLSLWSAINGDNSVALNPWVWVYRFKPHLTNVDNFIRQQEGTP